MEIKKHRWSLHPSPYLHWKLYAGMPVSTAQCCPFFRSQLVEECSCTVDTLQDQISGSRLPWPLIHPLFSFLPSSFFVTLPPVFSGLPSGALLPHQPPYIPVYVGASVSLCMCVCTLGSWAEIAILFLGPCCCLIAFVLFTLPAWGTDSIRSGGFL